MAIRYWSDFKKPKYRDVDLFLTSVGKQPQNKEVYPNGLPNYHLLLTVSGEGRLYKNDGSFLLSPDTIMIHKSNTPLEYAPKTKRWVTAWLTYNGKDAAHLFGFPYGVYRIKNRSTIVSKIDEIIALPEPRRQSSGKKLLRELFLLLSEEIYLPALEPTAEDRVTPIEKMTLYIQHKYHKHISVDDLAAVINCGRTTVNNLFRKHLGTSPAQYILRFRVYMAEEFLKNSPEIPIKEVARLCGFKSSSYLDHRFRSGTPRSFQKQYMKKTEQ